VIARYNAGHAVHEGLHAHFSPPRTQLPDVSQYYIPRHVYFALENTAVIFLDLRSDRYSMLVGPEARVFKTLISDHRRRVLNVRASADPQDHEIRHRVLRGLLENGLLGTDHIPGEALAQADIPIADRNLMDIETLERPVVCARDTWRLTSSCIISHLRLKHERIEQTVDAMERRKKLHLFACPAALAEVRRLVSIYDRLRPLFPKDYLCLFDSLSLFDFLTRYGLFPTWVFAVKLDPWSAHCWLQYGTVALNEDVEVARTYVPIMAI
jgi:hypothetical protein